MARINIDIGTLGNPATGDTLRTAMIKINNNFTEVYSLVRDGSSGLIATDVTNGDLKLQANGTGNIEIDQLSINGDSITSIATNGSVDITGNGTGGVNIEALSFNGTSISSTDSSSINLNENVTVDGDLNVTGNITGTFSVSTVGDITAVGSTLTAPSNADLTLTTSGTGSVSVDGIQIKGTELSSTDSSQITIKENLHVTGNITGTIDADNSTVSNLEVDNFKAASIVTEAEGIGSNDNDTTLPTSAAVKDYVDARDIGDLSVTGSTISAPSNADLTLTTSGTGSVSIDGIQISGTEISSSDSTQITIKENLHVTGNISGTITGTVTGTIDADSSTISNLEVDNFKAATIVLESEGIGSNDNDTTIPTSAAVKDYVDNNAGGGSTGDITFTGSTISAPSNADLTLNAGGTGSVDIDGIQIKGTSISSTDSTQININENVSIDGTLTVGGASLSGTLNTAGNTGTGSVALASQSLQVTGTTNEINIEAAAFALTASLADNISGIVSVTASSFLANDAIKIIDNKITGTRSNENVELEANGTGGVIAQSPFTFNAGYIEKINTLTSSSTITVDCATASVHKVTLATSTQFNIANLPTGGTVTLIITQDGTGSRTATFGTDGSSAVKFPSNSSTLSTGAADIDVVTIINDGTNFLGNIAKDYRSS